MKLGPIQLRGRHLFCAAGLALLFPVLLMVVFAAYTPITASGFCYLIGAVVITFGLLTEPWLRRKSWLLLGAGILLLVVTAGVRLSVGGDGTTVRLLTMPDQGSTRWVNRLIHERDLSLFGQRVAALTGIALSPREAEGLTNALTAAYGSLAAVDGTTSSPCISTYLLRQRPDAFDMVVVEPAPLSTPAIAPPPSTAAVIYLHGFVGNFTIQAWLIAEAARKLNMLTVAPSVGFIGDWWTPHGEETVRHTIDYLRHRGIRRIYLAGLSNGAVGVCRLAAKLRTDLTGLILISGADAYSPDSGLPVLALQGRYDERMHPSAASRYIAQAGARGTYREFDGDHLLLAKRAAEVQAELSKWLERQEERAKNSR
jgi:pimeloyl-ACP methyl ester carboxylesterase